jgi:hypothetical protein
MALVVRRIVGRPGLMAPGPEQGTAPFYLNFGQSNFTPLQGDKIKKKCKALKKARGGGGTPQGYNGGTFLPTCRWFVITVCSTEGSCSDVYIPYCPE